MERFLAQHDLEFNGFPLRWLDGLFLGNGNIGAMVWGTGAPLIFTLDKYDVWEERNSFNYSPEHTYQDLRALLEAGRFEEAKQKYETEFGSATIYPTRIPLPRFELEFPIKFQGATARLHLADGTFSARVDLGGSICDMEGFVHASKNLLVISTAAGRNGMPQFTSHITTDHFTRATKDQLARWGYTDTEEGTFEVPLAPDGITYYFINAPEGAGFRAYCVAYVNYFDEITNKYLSLCGILTDRDLIASETVSEGGAVSKDVFLSAFQALFEESVKKGYPRLKIEQQAFWSAFWSKSFISLPDNIIENLYYIELYKMACNCRSGLYPSTLQGIWSIDGQMPAWVGAYHLDLNVPESYWGIYASNHLDLGEPLYRMFFNYLPQFQQWCHDFFGFEGAWARGSLSFGGNPLNGPYATEFWPGSGAWIAHLFWLHWRYSQDRDFLRERAFPFLRQFFITYSNLLEVNENGELFVPLSNAPEYHENQRGTWGKNPNCDLQLIHFLGGAILEASEVLGNDGEEIESELTTRVREVLDKLVKYPTDAEGFQLMEGVPLTTSRQHLSHLMGVYPLGVIAWDTAELLLQNRKDHETQFLISQSIRKLNQLGFFQWTGWSFPWMSAICARAGNANLAYWFLKEYFKFIHENSMHVNGDSYDLSFCEYVYESMTLEGGFCMVAAVLEMLLQSHQGIIRVFPAVPPGWHDIRFDSLRAEGAFLISAMRSKGKLIYITIESEMGGLCRVRNDFDAIVELARKEGGIYVPEKVYNERPPVFEVETNPGDHYRLCATSFKATANALEKLSFAQVTRAFSGGNFFGHRSTAINPYLIYPRPS